MVSDSFIWCNKYTTHDLLSSRHKVQKKMLRFTLTCSLRRNWKDDQIIWSTLRFHVVPTEVYITGIKLLLELCLFLIQKMAPKSPYNSLPKSLRVHMKEILMNGSPKCQSDLNKGDYCLPLIPYVMLQEPWQQMSPFLTIVVILTQTNMFKQSKLSIYF